MHAFYTFSFIILILASILDFTHLCFCAFSSRLHSPRATLLTNSLSSFTLLQQFIVRQQRGVSHARDREGSFLFRNLAYFAHRPVLQHLQHFLEWLRLLEIRGMSSRSVLDDFVISFVDSIHSDGWFIKLDFITPEWGWKLQSCRSMLDLELPSSFKLGYWRHLRVLDVHSWRILM